MRQWIYASLAILSAAITTWVLHATQETWRAPTVAAREIQTDARRFDPEIEVLEAELARIQQRLDALRSRTKY